MRASAVEFRLRMLIMVVIVFVGFWSPWLGGWDFGRRISTLEWLPLELSRLGVTSFAVATPIVIVFSALIALGYKPPEVTRLLKSADEPGLSTTEIIRRALKSAVKA